MLTSINIYLNKVQLCLILLSVAAIPLTGCNKSIDVEDINTVVDSTDLESSGFSSGVTDSTFKEYRKSDKENESNSIASEKGDVGSETEGMIFKSYIAAYEYMADKLRVDKVSLLFVDEDDIPELLVIDQSYYRLFKYASNGEIKEIAISPAGVIPCVYGLSYEFGQQDRFGTVFWFDYVPYRNLIRVHSINDPTDDISYERHDYYIRLGEDETDYEVELETFGQNDITFKYKDEIVENGIFSSKRKELGYDQLIPCTQMYSDIHKAQENIENEESINIIDDFISGEAKAIAGVDKDNIIIYKSFKEIVDELTYGEKCAYVRFVDINNDKKRDMEICGYDGRRDYYIAVGDVLMRIKYASSTIDMCEIVNTENGYAIRSCDNMHADRTSYRYIMYDNCGCPYDCETIYHWWNGFDGSKDKEGYEYRGRPSDKEEYESVLNKYEEVKGGYKTIYVEEFEVSANLANELYKEIFE